MENNKVVLRDGTVLIDITDSTITPEDLLSGVVAYNRKGERIVGTMAELIIDTAMSDSSENAVQNKVIKAYVDNAVRDAIRHGVPDTYAILEYIQGDGNAYIDTGLTLDGDLSFSIETGAIPSGKIGAILTGYNSGTAANGRQGFMIFNTSSHKLDYYWMGVGYSTLSVDSNINMGAKFRVVQNKSSVTIEQGGFMSTAEYEGTDAVNTAHVLLLHSTNPNHSTYNYGRIYSASVFDGTDLIRRFTPAMRKSDSAIGLYDSVTDTLFQNAGGGSLIAGAIIG